MRTGLALLLASFVASSVEAGGSADPLSDGHAFAAVGEQQGAARAATGVIRGEATAQGGQIRLPGITITVTPKTAAVPVAEAVSDAAGRFVMASLAGGVYEVRAAADGFRDTVQWVTLAAGAEVALTLDLTLAAAATIDVSATEAFTAAARPAQIEVDAVRDLPVGGSVVDAAGALMPGVVFGPDGRTSIRGAGAIQSSVQISRIDASDPSVLGRAVELPDGAVATVRVLPNPYTVEFGRFSSGVTVLETRTGSNVWRLSTGDLLPSFQTSRGYFRGLRWFSPEATVSGPIVRDKLFAAHSTHYYYNNREIYSRPDEESIEQRNLRTFGRVDAVLAPGHTLAVSASGSTGRLSFATLDTFSTPEASADQTTGGATVTASLSNVLSPAALLETTVNAGTQKITALGRGSGPMDLLPDITRGNYFNDQKRRVHTFQVVQSLSRSWSVAGQHALKFGYDLLATAFRGTSASRDVEIRRTDETLAELRTYSRPVTLRADAADLALFVQDGWRPAERLSIDGGVRLDRDGVLGRYNVTVRAGGAFALNDTGDAVLRGGFGTFYERVPLTVSAFEDFEAPTVTAFLADGVTPAGPAQRFAYRRTEDLETPRSTIWNAGYEHVPARGAKIRFGYLERRDGHRLLVQPSPTGEPAIVLSGDGRGHYRDVETGFQYRLGWLETDASYVRAWSLTDLNAFELYFRNFRNPIIRENGVGPSGAHVPHRIQIRNRFLTERWVLGTVLEARSGFPFSAIDENQEFVGPRNRAGRFPAGVLLDILIQREVPVLRWRPWIGVTIRNVFDAFVPSEVQRNIDSPQYGTFFNSRPRQLNVTVRIR
jgi:hypothetical protein